MESPNFSWMVLAGALALVSITATTTLHAASDSGPSVIAGDAQDAQNNAREATRVGDFNTREDDADDSVKAVTVHARLFDIARDQRLPQLAMVGLSRIYGYEFDLYRQARAGDTVKIVCGSDGVAQDALLTAELSFDGQAHRLYRFKTTDGVVDYYDDAGQSWRTRLIRKPIAEGIMASGFGMHFHPILGYARMHTGVDWAAELGTPVYAAGDGEVVKASWSGGDGNVVRIDNGDGFATGYAHLQKIVRGLHPGSHVRQGQMIGNVGSTGVSTGPHLHYEILVNDRYVDPLRVKLPPARILDGDELAAFMRERARLDESLEQSPARELAP
jgi:murein DD-endopeptidase MepM/ murein hydrolase activator NlpD